MKKARIAILGYGVIGKGVFKICLEKEEIEVIKIFDYKENFDKQYANLFTDNLEDIINDNKIDIVVEVLGGYDFAKKACVLTLSKHKHLVTANKEIVANDIDELTKLARDNKVSFCYEASVGWSHSYYKKFERTYFSESYSKNYWNFKWDNKLYS